MIEVYFWGNTEKFAILLELRYDLVLDARRFPFEAVFAFQ